MIDSGASFHFIFHREWFHEYEKYYGGDFFLSDERKARIIGHKNVKLKLQGGKIPSVPHIPTLAKKLISINNMDDASVKNMFKKYICKMVRGARVLMQGVHIGTIYRLLGSIVIEECNIFLVLESGA